MAGMPAQQLQAEIGRCRRKDYCRTQGTWIRSSDARPPHFVNCPRVPGAVPALEVRPCFVSWIFLRAPSYSPGEAARIPARDREPARAISSPVTPRFARSVSSPGPHQHSLYTQRDLAAWMLSRGLRLNQFLFQNPLRAWSPTVPNWITIQTPRGPPPTLINFKKTSAGQESNRLRVSSHEPSP